MRIDVANPPQTLTVRPLSAPPVLDRARTAQAPGETSSPPTDPNALTNADGDTATFSTEATRRSAQDQPSDPGAPRARNGDPLTDEQQREVQELAKRDAQVKAHEQAHVAAAGPLYRGGPNYEYETGPDGKRYAIAGNVQIDTSPGRTPEETVTKAAQIRRAALAPADPSSTDQTVAAQASRMEAQARQELAEESPESGADQTSPAQPTNPGPRPTRQAIPAIDIYA